MSYDSVADVSGISISYETKTANQLEQLFLHESW